MIIIELIGRLARGVVLSLVACFIYFGSIVTYAIIRNFLDKFKR